MNQMTLNRVNKMADIHEQMVLSKAKKGKGYTASSFSDDWKTTTHSSHYEANPD